MLTSDSLALSSEVPGLYFYCFFNQLTTLTTPTTSSTNLHAFANFTVHQNCRHVCVSWEPKGSNSIWQSNQLRKPNHTTRTKETQLKLTNGEQLSRLPYSKLPLTFTLGWVWTEVSKNSQACLPWKNYSKTKLIFQIGCTSYDPRNTCAG